MVLFYHCLRMFSLSHLSAPSDPDDGAAPFSPSDSQVKIDILNPEKRPVSATADSTEIRNVKTIEIRQSDRNQCTLLFDPDNHLEERILKEQFES